MSQDRTILHSVLVDPAAPRCPDCGSGDVRPWLPSSAPLSRNMLLWLGAIAYCILAAWFWLNTRTPPPPRSYALVAPVDHRHLGNIFALTAAVVVLWCAGLSILSKRRPVTFTHCCATCGACFNANNGSTRA